MPEIPHAGAFELSPDWVCEVLSPSTEAVDRGKKTRVYAREGVAVVWLVNPFTRTLEVMELASGLYRIVEVCLLCIGKLCG
jgi:Uma2 family endonuclease